MVKILDVQAFTQNVFNIILSHNDGRPLLIIFSCGFQYWDLKPLKYTADVRHFIS